MNTHSCTWVVPPSISITLNEPVIGMTGVQEMIMRTFAELLSCGLLVLWIGGCFIFERLSEGEAEQGISVVATEIAGTIASVSTEKTCYDGGTLQMIPTLSLDDTNVQFVFTACSADDVIVNGDFTVGVALNGFSVGVMATGTLDFNGRIDGICDIDARITFGVWSTDVGGDVCGYESTDLISLLLRAVADDLLDIL